MRKRLFKGQDHPDLATSLNNLAFLYRAQGKLGAAEPLFKDALEMRKRLFKGQDHPDLAGSLNDLAFLYRDQGKLGDAEPLFKDALEMRKRLFKGQDHPDLAISLNNLASLYHAQGKLIDAEPLLKDALEMRTRLFKGQDHPDLAQSLNNLAGLYRAQGKLGDAEPLFKDALEMRKRLSKGQDHPDLACSLNNLAILYQDQGKLGDAEPLFKDALELYRRLAVAFAQDKTEGETLTLLAHQPLTRDAYLSTALGHETDPAGVYAQVWADKGYIARAYERRLLQARAVATDPKAAGMLADLTDARRRRAELLLAPATKDPATLAQRKQDIATYEACIEEKTRELKVLLPASVRADKLAAAIPSDLQKALPADAAVVDFLRFVHFEHDKDKPGKAGETRTRRYLAFVVTKEKVAWVDLDIAEMIEPAVNAWRSRHHQRQGDAPGNCGEGTRTGLAEGAPGTAGCHQDGVCVPGRSAVPGAFRGVARRQARHHPAGRFRGGDDPARTVPARQAVAARPNQEPADKCTGRRRSEVRRGNRVSNTCP